MAQQTINTKNALKPGEIRANDMITVYGTAKSKMGTGKAYQVHKVAAEKLVANGMATYEEPKTKEGK